MIIKLVRHGESLQNLGEINATEIGDFNVPLSARGWEQSVSAGKQIGSLFLANSLIYVSPYMRTRQTLTGIINGANALSSDTNLRIYEDIRLREVEFGFNKAAETIDQEMALRETHGYMFYRFDGGESPADCYDRICSFLESMMRQVERKKISRILVVSHGLTIRCFITRFLHLKVEDYARMRNPVNGAIITITDHSLITEKPQFRHKKWAVTGLRLREEKIEKKS